MTTAIEIAARTAIAIRIGTSGEDPPSLPCEEVGSVAAVSCDPLPGPAEEPLPWLPWPEPEPLPVLGFWPPVDEPFPEEPPFEPPEPPEPPGVLEPFASASLEPFPGSDLCDFFDVLFGTVTVGGASVYSISAESLSA